MSDSSAAHIKLFDNEDPEMQRAYQQARATFRYFWRELSWERRRIIPALDVACVKAVFSDGASNRPSEGSPQAEQMWIEDVDFDGQFITGTLLNSPNWLKSVKQGDDVRIPAATLTDWIYAVHGEVYGAFTVHVLRSKMGRAEMREHDGAWGLNFGDPAQPRIVPIPQQSGGLLKRWFGSTAPSQQELLAAEHPMSEAMAEKLREQLAVQPDLLTHTDPRGWTFLHQEALAGNLATVQVLLAAGANRQAVTHHGATPLQLARVLGWERVIATLSAPT